MGYFVMQEHDKSKDHLVRELSDMRSKVAKLESTIASLEDINRTSGESELAFRTMTELSPDWEYWITPNGSFIYMSPSCELITGYAQDEFVNDTNLIREVVHREDWPRSCCHFEIRDSSDLRLSKFRIITKTLEERWIEYRCQPIFGADGSFLGRRVNNRDITDRKNLEEKGLRLAAIVESSDDAIIGKTLDGIITSWNRAAEKIYGYKEHEVIGRPISLLVPDQANDEIDAMLSNIRHGELVEHFETVRRTKHGAIISVSLTVSPIANERGQIIGASTIARDITNRKRAEQLIRDAERNQRLLIENLQAGVIVFDPDLTIRLSNKIAAETLGLSLDEIVGLSLLDPAWIFLHEHGSPMPVEEYPLVKVAATKQPISDMVVGINAPGKTDRVWVLANAYPVISDKKELEQIVVTFVDITGRKKAEAALRENEEKFRLLYEQAPIPYQSLDEDGNLLDVNEAWLEALGYSWDEVIGKNLAEFLSPRSQEIFVHSFPWFKDTGHVRGFDHEMVCKDKTVMDVSFNGRVSLSQFGKFSRTHCVFQDVTQRKMAEKALRESEEKFRATFNTASVGMDIVDRQGRFLEVNSTFCDFLGYTDDELKTMSIFDVTHPDDLDNTRELHEGLIRGRTKTYRQQKRLIRKDGRIVWADLAVSSLSDTDMEHQRTVGVIIDITGRKRSEEARLRLSAAVEQSPEAIVITDVDGTIVYVNPAFERITGYSPGEVIGSNPRILKSGHQDKGFYENFWDTITHGRTWIGHLVNKKKDGSLYEEDVSVSPVKDTTGKIVNYVAVKRDVTEDVSLQRQLRQAQKMEAIGTLAGGVAHDFNNVLQIVLGFSEIMFLDKEFPDRFSADLKAINEAAKRGADLVSRLMTFSRKSEFKPQPLNLNHRIIELRKMLERTLPKIIDIELVLGESLSAINADPNQLDQVLMNLAVNARDAMPEGGRLSFQTSNIVLDHEYTATHIEVKPGPHVLLIAEDTGCGIDSGALEHIFEPFYTTKEIGKGTGLGLAIVHGIVKQHGGHIVCESQQGKGTTFKIYFPALVSGKIGYEVAKTSAFRGGPETILIVDDDQSVREIGARILEKAGYKVMEATNGIEAVEVYSARKKEIALIVLDVIMPKMDGRQCLKELLSIDPSVKVVVASGQLLTDSMKETNAPGAKACIKKPYDVREALEIIRTVLDGP